MEPERRRKLLPLVRPPELGPVLDALYDKLSSQCGPKGSIVVETTAAADALEDLIGKRVPPGKRIRLSEVDRLLAERTPFLSLQEAVELYRDAPVVFPRVDRAHAAEARDRAIRRCFRALSDLGLPDPAYARMVSWLYDSKPYLRKAYGHLGEQELLDAVRAVGLAFGRMAAGLGSLLYLAELAQEVAADAKALDPNRPAGRLLLHALAFHYPETAARERRGSTAWRTNLWSEAGIARDPISVRVDTFGLLGDTPYLHELRRAGLTRPVNLDDLEQIGADVRAWRSVAFVVENPTAFAALVRHVRSHYVPEKHPTLVCTNGNLNLADRLLLDALEKAGTHLFYAGDFDARGLAIADAVLDRGTGVASPWRMGAADYDYVVREEGGRLNAQALERNGRNLADLSRAMRARGRAAHQEGLIPLFKADLDRFVTRGETPPRRGEPPRAAAHAITP